MTSPADDFAAALAAAGASTVTTTPTEPPGPRAPAPNRAQGTGGTPVVSPNELGQRLLVAAFQSTRAGRGDGGWTSLTTTSPY